jgi:hypothetical protein
MAIDLTYINAALTRSGFNTISTIPGTTAEGKVAAQNYERMIVGILTGYPWKFATTTRRLNHLSAAPDLPWLHAYQKPADLLKLRTVKVNGVGIAYEVMTDKILCDVDEDSDVIATFTYRVAETYWPGDFGEAVIRRLEAMFLRSPAGQYDEAKSRDDAADEAFERAKLADSQNKTPTDPRTYPTLVARRGGAVSGRA